MRASRPRLALPHLAASVLLLAAAAGACAQTATPVPSLTEGEYIFELGGNRVGREAFVLTAGGWEARGSFELLGRKVEFDITLARDEGAWQLEARYRRPEGPLHLRCRLTGDRYVRELLEEDGVTVKDEGKKTVTLSAERPVTLFENLVWTHLIDLGREIAARARSKTLEPGLEFRAVLVSAARKFSIRVLEFQPSVQMHDGKKLALWRGKLDLGGVEMSLLCTQDGVPVRVQVPTQQVDLMLVGYEDLAPPIMPPSTPLDTGAWREQLSPARHPVTVEKKVMIPMRDGVRLAADVYRPKAKGRHPTVLARTPYRRQGDGLLWGMYFARRGYVVVTQDCRGRFDSEGDWYPVRHEIRDGYDTLQWITQQEWSDGGVGMIGGSYVGWVQWLAARSGHPALKAIVPMVAPPDPHENIPYEGGVFFLPSAWWAYVLEKMSEVPGEKKEEERKREEKKDDDPASGGVKWNRVFRTLPLADLDRALKLEHSFLDDWLAHPLASDPYWKEMQYQRDYDRIDVPALHMTGWFDGDQPGSIMNYGGMRRAGRSARSRGLQWLVIGPWSHALNTTRRLGRTDFGDQALIDMQAVVLRWFDYHLKAIDNGVADEDPVSVFVMGQNRWRQEKDWPLPATQWTRLHLVGAPANRRDGAGQLALEPRGGPPNTYVYDPADPAPTPKPDPENPADYIAGFDYDSLSDRDDVLDFTSAPLAAPADLIGPVTVHLTVATDAPDTDFAAVLLRVTPEGKAIGLATGIQRLRYRFGMEADAPVKPGQAARVTIDLWSTGIRLDRGDRLRVQVQSSLFPPFARNLNTGEPEATGTEMRKANQKVFGDVTRPSYVLLPVVPGPDTPGLTFEKEASR